MITATARWIYCNMLDENSNIRCWVTSDWCYVSDKYTLSWNKDDWNSIHNIHRSAKIQMEYIKYNAKSN